MKSARMKRLFGTSGNCFDVAIDHGMFNEPGFLNGIENMHNAIRVVADAEPDAIQLPPGTAPILQAISGKALWWEMCAIIVVMIIPVIIMAILLTRFISKGVLMGAMKG